MIIRITMIGFYRYGRVSGDHSNVYVHHEHTYVRETVINRDPGGS